MMFPLYFLIMINTVIGFVLSEKSSRPFIEVKIYDSGHVENFEKGSVDPHPSCFYTGYPDEYLFPFQFPFGYWNEKSKETMKPKEPIYSDGKGLDNIEDVDTRRVATALDKNLNLVLEYLWEVHGFLSYDGKGSPVVACINIGPKSDGPFLRDDINSSLFGEVSFEYPEPRNGTVIVDYDGEKHLYSKTMDDAFNLASDSYSYFPKEYTGESENMNLLFFAENWAGVSWAETIDFVAHEFGHGLFGATAQRNWPEWANTAFWKNEFQGVNEHMCDFLAAVVKNYDGQSTEYVYTMGKDLYNITGRLPLRDMRKPNESLFKKTEYFGQFDNLTEIGATQSQQYDYANVANLAFYLVSEGGSHPTEKYRNETGGIVVEGIGIENSEQIWWRALTDCLTVGSKLVNLRYCTETKFGGEFSKNVGDAWDAVGVPAGEPPIQWKVPELEQDESSSGALVKGSLVTSYGSIIVLGLINLLYFFTV